MKEETNHVHKALSARLGCLALGAVLLSSQLLGDTNPSQPMERFAALECQNNEAFVIINFYPGNLFKLSWGYDLNLEVEDLLVTQSFEHGWEIYRGNGIYLRLPSRPGGASNDVRIGSLNSRKPVRLIQGSLRCLLHGAD